MKNLAPCFQICILYLRTTGRLISQKLGSSLRGSTVQCGTKVKFRWSHDHNNRTAENTFSTPWYYSEMELEPAAG